MNGDRCLSCPPSLYCAVASDDCNIGCTALENLSFQYSKAHCWPVYKACLKNYVCEHIYEF